MAKPPWLKIKLPNQTCNQTKQLIQKLGVATVCREAKCPNANECWGNKTATFMILGKICTRGCRFCNVKTGRKGEELDWGEIGRIANAVRKLKLKYAVITSVDRDDLHDLGSKYFAECIRRIKKLGVLVEVLTPDFQGKVECMQRVAEEMPHVFGHNIETVERLTTCVRDARASYEQSLGVLRYVSENYGERIIVKSGLMVGFGETKDEIIETLKDLRDAGVRAISIGQYLQPTKNHIQVKEYITPKKFDEYGRIAKQIGYEFVASGPFVRSSYRAWEMVKNNKC